MVPKLTALGVLIALVLVLLINTVSPAAPPSTTTADNADAATTTARTPRDTDAKATLKNVDGNVVGVVRFDALRGGRVDVTAEVNNVAPAGQFHGFHVHTTGECDPNAVDPATGATVPFFTAGGHLNPTNTVHGQHAGDFPVLLVQSGGGAKAKFRTDRFKLSQLFDEDGSAVIVHAGLDNYANIPERYHSHPEDVMGPDSVSRATGDAGARFACGVVVRRT